MAPDRIRTLTLDARIHVAHDVRAMLNSWEERFYIREDIVDRVRLQRDKAVTLLQSFVNEMTTESSLPWRRDLDALLAEINA